MYCFLVHFTADNIFIFNLKSSIFTKLTMRVTWFLVQELVKSFSRTCVYFSKKFNLGNPLKSTFCSIFIMKLAEVERLEAKITSFFGVFSVSFWRVFSSKSLDCNITLMFLYSVFYICLLLHNILTKHKLYCSDISVLYSV